MKNLLREVKGNIYGLGVYCFKDAKGKVLYVGSGMINDRLQTHLYNLKRGLYEDTNKDILQRTYNAGNLSFEVLKFSENNSIYLHATNEERDAIQEALEILEQFYYNLYKDTCCNKITKITKRTSSPNLETTHKRKKANLGENNPNCTKLCEEDVKEIKKLLAKGVKQTELAEQYQVSPTLIHNIKIGERWGSVEI